jgi:hypothetical protein
MLLVNCLSRMRGSAALMTNTCIVTCACIRIRHLPVLVANCLFCMRGAAALMTNRYVLIRHPVHS